MEHILGLRRLIEGIKANNLSAITTYIDFKKAFNTIHRGKMLRILKAYGIPDQTVEAIGKIYENTQAKVISTDGETECELETVFNQQRAVWRPSKTH